MAQFGISHEASAVSSYRLVGTEGDLLVQHGFGYGTDIEHALTVGGKTQTRTFKNSDPFAPELIYFSRCVLEDREPEPNGIEGLADVRVIVALQESARTGRPVKLAPFEKPKRPTLEQLIVKPAVEPPEPVNAPAPAQG